MDDSFSVEFVALHLVDRQLPGPKFCEQAFSMDSFKNPEDRSVLQDFFSRHFSEMWAVEESRRTRAAVFESSAELKSYYQEIEHDSQCFYTLSCKIAQRLFDVSHSTTASPGVLLIVWLTKVGEASPYLVLMKLDPGPSDLVGLGRSPDGSMLLDFAVHHIDMALPNSQERVLKWAILPHPNREGMDVKVRDEQGRADTARYFMDFLGCKERASQKEQTYCLLEALAEVAQVCHPSVDCHPIVQEILEDLEDETVITPERVLQKVDECGKLPHFKEAAFRASLKEHNAAELNVPGKVLAGTKLEYRLVNGITIRGPRAAVENLVEVRKLADGSYEFTVRAPDYARKYAG